MTRNTVEATGEGREHIPDEKNSSKNDTDSVSDAAEWDPFIPFPIEEGVPEEPHSRILTLRAIAVGCTLGGLVNASNLYLGE